ncbi:MAG: pilus assembly protein N-terminal domain-containing protein [Deltaproteobacteria bacterium]|nr:pilus assembly protein N-terminal domain-containing protein [Deltaproteobacteria bacterium]
MFPLKALACLTSGILVAVAALSVANVYGQEVPGGNVLAVDAGASRTIRLARPAASVSVVDPAIADVQLVSPEVLLVYGKAAGRTSLAVFGADDMPVGRWTVTVTVELESIRSALSEDAELRNVKVRPAPRGGVELSGVVASAAVVERALQLARASLPENAVVINRLSVAGPQQVNLEVQIAEVQRSVSESLGINWEAIGTRATGQFGFRVGRLLGDAPLGAAFPEGQASAAFGSYASPRGSTSIRGLIDALATAGLATVLARPNVTAVSGETASFFSGGEYPLPSGIEQGQVKFDYKKYGVLLDFVPTVIDSNRISLTVRPEVSQRVGTDALRILDTEIPVIDVRRAETTVEVGNGESIVIAGLYRNQSDTQEAGVPGLKDVPTLGLLFGNRTVRSNSTELIVVVTARLIAPTQARTEARERRVSSRRVRGYHY